MAEVIADLAAGLTARARRRAPGRSGRMPLAWAGRTRQPQLKTWRVLRKLRCGPHCAGRLAKAIHVLQDHELAAG
jgi:hypothetical protein